MFELTGMCVVEFADVFEEVLEIVSYMTYFSPVISPNMWSLWPLMVDAVQDWAIDYFESEYYGSRCLTITDGHSVGCPAPFWFAFQMCSSHIINGGRVLGFMSGGGTEIFVV